MKIIQNTQSAGTPEAQTALVEAIISDDGQVLSLDPITFAALSSLLSNARDKLGTDCREFFTNIAIYDAAEDVRLRVQLTTFTDSPYKLLESMQSGADIDNSPAILLENDIGTLSLAGEKLTYENKPNIGNPGLNSFFTSIRKLSESQNLKFHINHRMDINFD